MVNRLCIIGIGYRPLYEKAREIVLRSDVILASGRLFDIFRRYEEFKSVRDRVEVIDNVEATMNFIRSCFAGTEHGTSNLEGKTVVLLASGDPMFFGIGRRTVEEFGKVVVEVFPDLSSIQVAFSKIKEPWDDVFFMSLHGGPDPQKRRKLRHEKSDIPFLLAKHHKIAILTDKENNPGAIAKILAQSPITNHQSLIMYVCEKLGYPDERITEGAPEDIAKGVFSDPNVVILIAGNDLSGD